MYAIGLDIGTTTVSAAVVGLTQRAVVETKTLQNGSFIATANPRERIQNISLILKTALSLIGELTEKYPDTACIGVTGQMHGIVYLDANGDAVSPLFTWQDTRADAPDENGVTPSARLRGLTGYSVPAGYGLATHFANCLSGSVPESAAKLCTVHDYIVMKLTGRKKPLTHVSDAASLGLYILKDNRFDTKAVTAAGMNPDILPEVTAGETVAGYYKNIPVTVAIGDNQSSFLGSVSDTAGGVLVNVGTGSQVSAVENGCREIPGCELRPFVGGKYLAVGCALCGGRAYACLEAFFRSYAQAAGLDNVKQYDILNSLADTADNNCGGIRVDTAFAGTRADPSRRGAVTGISEENLTPANLIRGVLTGMTDELYSFTEAFMGGRKPTLLVGSGNGIRRNRVLSVIVGNRFGAPLRIPVNGEEAAFGAALFACVGSGTLSGFTDAGRLVTYQ